MSQHIPAEDRQLTYGQVMCVHSNDARPGGRYRDKTAQPVAVITPDGT
jgi:hypothetical protein